MTAHTTYEATVATVGPSNAATKAANQTTLQTSIDNAKSVVGYTLQTGNNVALIAAIAAANIAKKNADFAAEQAKQATLMLARDALRTGGDFGPV